MRNAGLEEAQAGIKIAGRNINNLRYPDDTTCREIPGGLLRLDPAFAFAKPPSSRPLPRAELLTPAPRNHPYGRKWRRTKEPLGESGGWKSWLKLNIQKTKIMASGPITSWQIDGESVETVADFIFQGSKITADVDCSHEIKRRLLLGRKVMTNLDSTLKCRDIILPTKVSLLKAMVFPVVMYGYDSWTIKIAERRRIDAFELWCLRRLLTLGLQGDPTGQS